MNRCLFCGDITVGDDGQETDHLVDGRCPKRTGCHYCDEGVMHAAHVCGNYSGQGVKPALVSEFESYHD